jgi:glycosyltransferase involved in cell wall biosynthesis
MLDYRNVRPELQFLDGFEIRRFPAGPEYGKAPLTPSLLNEVFKFEFDVIHTHELVSPASFYSAAASIFRRKPLIVTQHDDAFGNTHGAKLLVQMITNNTAGRFVAHTARAVITLSRGGMKFVRRFGAAPNKTVIIPTSVDTRLFAPGPSKALKTGWGVEGKIVLFVGNLIKRKGVDMLMRAFQRTLTAVPDARLVIVGTGPEEQKLRNLQSRLNLEEIYFVGKMPRPEMPEVYRSCDVLVLPSLYYEIFGNVIIEAMASGLPVICTRIGGMRDLVIHGKTGFQVAPGDPLELSRYLVKLLSDDELKDEMSRAARRVAVQKYDDVVLARAVERIYLESLRHS